MTETSAYESHTNISHSLPQHSLLVPAVMCTFSSETGVCYLQRVKPNAQPPPPPPPPASKQKASTV